MSGSSAGYDISASIYSPEGQIFQVEYATKAVESSGTLLAVRCSDGIVMGVEKLLISKMLVPGSNRRLFMVDSHIGVGVAGLLADGRQIVNRARSECENYRTNYGEPIPPQVLVNRLGDYIHYFTLHGALRPFGVTTMIIGFDHGIKTQELYGIEPSGVTFKYFGYAAGKGKQAGKTEIEKLPLNTISCRDALKEIAKILLVLHDEAKDKSFELEMSWISSETNWRYQLVPQELINEAEQFAKLKIEEEENDDNDEDI